MEKTREFQIASPIDTLIMLINGIIIIHLSKSIEFNFDWALNTIEFFVIFSYVWRMKSSVNGER